MLSGFVIADKPENSVCPALALLKLTNSSSITELSVHPSDITEMYLAAGSFLLSSSALQFMKSFVWLTFIYVLCMFRPLSPENESNTFPHRSVKIAIWNIPPHLSTVCFFSSISVWSWAGECHLYLQAYFLLR